MTAKIMISIPDELKAMIDEYNKIHRFRKLHISEICQEAIFNAVTSGGMSNGANIAMSKLLRDNQDLKVGSIVYKKLISQDESDKHVLPCPICGTDFVQTKPTRQYCSKKCGTTASRRRNKDVIL